MLHREIRSVPADHLGGPLHPHRQDVADPLAVRDLSQKRLGHLDISPLQFQAAGLLLGDEALLVGLDRHRHRAAGHAAFDPQPVVKVRQIDVGAGLHDPQDRAGGLERLAAGTGGGVIARVRTGRDLRVVAAADETARTGPVDVFLFVESDPELPQLVLQEVLAAEARRRGPMAIIALLELCCPAGPSSRNGRAASSG